MNDPTDQDPPPPDPTEEIPLPPPSAGPTGPPRRLRRSRDDRMISGVSGGIAEYFAIDPIIVRLGFFALALLGGSGIGIYLIAWLVMPDATEDESAALNALRGGDRPGGRSIVALVLVVLGILIFSGSLFWSPFDGGLFLPLLVLAAGIALLVWPADGPRFHDSWAHPDADWRREREAMRGEWRRERQAWRDSRRQWRHGYRRGVQPDDASPTDTAGPPPPRPRRPRPPRPRPFLGPLAIATLLAFAGLTVLADEVGWWDTEPASFLAICLMIIGTVLVVSAVLGRARGLIWLGVFILPAAWAVAAIDLTWWDGVGEELVTVDAVEELQDEYRFGIGQFHVDLSDLDLEGGTHDLAVGLTIGELKVFVPETMEVEIDLDGRMGSVIVRDGDLRLNDDGIDTELDRVVGDPTGGTLVLDVDIGIGEAEVVVCGSGDVPCP
ncbi:MAG: PspC domain-containing protein [Acidimicrobiales bacterium]|nr:PspC domain-containing protein [Acidimicrobiales bacterium]